MVSLVYRNRGGNCRDWGVGLRVQSLSCGAHPLGGLPGNIGLPGVEDKVERPVSYRPGAFYRRDYVGDIIYSVPEIYNFPVVARNYLLDAGMAGDLKCV